LIIKKNKNKKNCEMINELERGRASETICNAIAKVERKEESMKKKRETRRYK
jgi:hypothetical protein